MSSKDFALAQQRLALRRQAREAENQARLQALTASSNQRLEQLPAPLARIGRGGISVWNNISGREGTRPAFRVGQVDAELLDGELVELLKNQVGDGLKYFGGHLMDDWNAEILLALRAILFKLTIWDHDVTYGAALQNLKFTDARHKGPALVPPSKWQKALYGLFSVGGHYSWTRWEGWLADQDNGYDELSRNTRLLSNITSRLSAVHSAAAMVSFLVFLVNGRYRTLLDRVLRLRLAPPTSQVSREVSFEYLNRQLVWHAFTEFLLFVLPLVGISRWRRWLARGWKRTKSLIRTGVPEDDLEEGKGELSFLPERTCAICYQDQNSAKTEAEILAASGASGGIIGSAQTDITNPYETIPCGCIYCFVCLAGRIEAEEGDGWTCLRCGETVKECEPWNGDVLEDVSKTSSKSRKVGFSEHIDEKDIGESMVRVVHPELSSEVDSEDVEEEEEEEEEQQESNAADEHDEEDNEDDDIAADGSESGESVAEHNESG